MGYFEREYLLPSLEEEEEPKFAMIKFPNTSSNPEAMMVKFPHTAIAVPAMSTSIGLNTETYLTESSLREFHCFLTNWT